VRLKSEFGSTSEKVTGRPTLERVFFEQSGYWRCGQMRSNQGERWRPSVTKLQLERARPGGLASPPAFRCFSPHDLRHRRISLWHLAGMPWAGSVSMLASGIDKLRDKVVEAFAEWRVETGSLAVELLGDDGQGRPGVSCGSAGQAHSNRRGDGEPAQ
jgi:hypothetical protein